MSKFYAVKCGYTTGIFTNWTECKESVNGFSGAEYKSFPTRKMAEEYLINDRKIAEEYLIDARKIEGVKKLSPNKLTYQIWTDGSAVLHKKAGYGFVILNENEEILSEGFGKVESPFTAPHAEIHALKNALEKLDEVLDENEIDKNKIHVEIFCDSQYVVKSLSIWGDKRTTADWYEKEYPELLLPMYKLIKKRNYKIQHVAAHSDIPWNEYADKLARKTVFNS